MIRVGGLGNDTEEDRSDVDSDGHSDRDSNPDECGNEERSEDEQFRSFVEEPIPKGDAEPSARPARNRTAPSWHRDYEVDYAGFALNATSYVEDLPTTVSECRQREDWPLWKQAMQEEMDSLVSNEKWTLVKLPEGRNAVTCKWIFKLKHSEDNEAPRYKARLVARGFTQKQGFDYSDTYSPLARMDTLRTVLALANQRGWSVHQMDVKCAFLNGELTEEIYMLQPEGFEQRDGLVCRLKRSLYGLKQAARSWNERFHNFVVRLGFVRSRNDLCLYRRGSGDTQVILVIYVDDVLIASGSEKLVGTIKKCLSTEFEMTDVGEVRNFLGMRIDRDAEKKTLRISQRRYLENLLDRFQMRDCRPIATPMENRLKLPKGEESKRMSKP
ncbi:hypothetical protein RP20_CCG014246 [Aedes albopictus]|nr:hypothetical protein RP20_CCG014246 [Aedes albopictus]